MRNGNQPVSEQMNMQPNQEDSFMIGDNIDRNGIQTKIEIITKDDVKKDLEDLVEKIIKITGNRITAEPLLNKNDFRWLYGRKPILWFACWSSFYHLAIKGNYTSIIPGSQWDDIEGFTRLKRVEKLSEKEKLLDCIKNSFDTILK
jgi:hypothetical protein